MITKLFRFIFGSQLGRVALAVLMVTLLGILNTHPEIIFEGLSFQKSEQKIAKILSLSGITPTKTPTVSPTATASSATTRNTPPTIISRPSPTIVANTGSNSGSSGDHQGGANGNSEATNTSDSGSGPTVAPTAIPPTITPYPSTAASPTVAPTSTSAPQNPGFTVTPGSLDISIGSRQKIENVFVVSYAGAPSFEMSVSLWHGGFVFSSGSTSLSPGQNVNVSLETFDAPKGVTNGTVTFKNPSNGATIQASVHIIVN